MFRKLYESFTDPQQELNQNIARYQSVEPNLVVFNSQNGYSFPNAGISANQQQTSNAALTNEILLTKDQSILDHYSKAVWQ